ncbi:hypothetical protein ScalyP_jg3859 [Parmales sp. scaly parma]|nr:hypothetical protein ScalyP_jg3859 [Parmales sp. scaly parma]
MVWGQSIGTSDKSLPSPPPPSLASIIANETTISPEEQKEEQKEKQFEADLRLALELSAVPTPPDPPPDPRPVLQPLPQLSPEELASINQAILQAETSDLDASVALAYQLSAEEDAKYASFQNQNRFTNQNGASKVQVAYSLHSNSLPPENSRELFSADDYEAHSLLYDSPLLSPPTTPSSTLLPTSTPGLFLDPTTGDYKTKHDPETSALKNGFKLNPDSNTKINSQTYNAYNRSMKRMTGNIKGVKRSGSGRAEKYSKGTHDGVLDDEVKMIILREINREDGALDEIHGIVAEGKEGVVFHGVGRTCDVAVKVFKRIQDFKNRADYVVGDFRYSSSSCCGKNNSSSSSSRVGLNQWTEKEFRNLKRLKEANVPTPNPLIYKANVLLMEFLALVIDFSKLRRTGKKKKKKVQRK